ncbi:MAG: hypothetical protein IKH02_02010 [Prevotella sp.]|nr:hypothetical protein [Prevotella sp.]
MARMRQSKQMPRKPVANDGKNIVFTLRRCLSIDGMDGRGIDEADGQRKNQCGAKTGLLVGEMVQKNVCRLILS